MPISSQDLYALLTPVTPMDNSSFHQALGGVRQAMSSIEDKRHAQAVEAEAAARRAQEQAQFDAAQAYQAERAKRSDFEADRGHEQMQRAAIAKINADAMKLPPPMRQAFVDSQMSALGGARTSGPTASEAEGSLSHQATPYDLVAKPTAEELKKAPGAGMGVGEQEDWFINPVSPSGFAPMPLTEQQQQYAMGGVDQFIDPSREAFIKNKRDARFWGEAEASDPMLAERANVSEGAALALERKAHDLDPGRESEESVMKRTIGKPGGEAAFNATLNDLVGVGPDLSGEADFTPKYTFGDGMEVQSANFEQLQFDQTQAGRQMMEKQLEGIMPREDPAFRAAMNSYEQAAAMYGPAVAYERIMGEYFNPEAGRLLGDAKAQQSQESREASLGLARRRLDLSEYHKGKTDSEQLSKGAVKAGEAVNQMRELHNALQDPALYNDPSLVAITVRQIGKGIAGEQRMTDADARDLAGRLNLKDSSVEFVERWLGEGGYGTARKENLSLIVDWAHDVQARKLQNELNAMDESSRTGSSAEYSRGFASNTGAIAKTYGAERNQGGGKPAAGGKKRRVAKTPDGKTFELQNGQWVQVK
jgi:hypothetical protein